MFDVATACQKLLAHGLLLAPCGARPAAFRHMPSVAVDALLMAHQNNQFRQSLGLAPLDLAAQYLDYHAIAAKSIERQRTHHEKQETRRQRRLSALVVKMDNETMRDRMRAACLLASHTGVSKTDALSLVLAIDDPTAVWRLARHLAGLGVGRSHGVYMLTRQAEWATAEGNKQSPLSAILTLLARPRGETRSDAELRAAWLGALQTKRTHAYQRTQQLEGITADDHTEPERPPPQLVLLSNSIRRTAPPARTRFGVTFEVASRGCAAA